MNEYVVILLRSQFCSIDIENKVVVATSLVNTKLPVHFDVDFPGLSCAEFGVDAVDTAGEQQLELSDDLLKEPIKGSHKGGSDGCRIIGTLHINRVKGEFHVAFGRQAIAESGIDIYLLHNFYIETRK